MHGLLKVSPPPPETDRQTFCLLRVICEKMSICFAEQSQPNQWSNLARHVYLRHKAFIPPKLDWGRRSGFFSFSHCIFVKFMSCAQGSSQVTLEVWLIRGKKAGSRTILAPGLPTKRYFDNCHSTICCYHGDSNFEHVQKKWFVSQSWHSLIPSTLREIYSPLSRASTHNMLATTTVARQRYFERKTFL